MITRTLLVPLLAIGLLGLLNLVWSLIHLWKPQWKISATGEWPLFFGVWIIYLILLLCEMTGWISLFLFNCAILLLSLLLELFALWLLRQRYGRDTNGGVGPLVVTGAYLLSYALASLLWLSHLFPPLTASMAQWRPGNTDEPSPLSVPSIIFFAVQAGLYWFLRIRWMRQGKAE